MTDHYSVLNLKIGAGQEEVDAAFDEVLAARRAKRQKTSDVHVAHAVLSDAGLRRTYDVTLRGVLAGERLAEAKDTAVEIVKDAIPVIKWSEVRKNAVQITLQTSVLVSGATAKVSDATGSVSRRVQTAAAKRISIDS